MTVKTIQYSSDLFGEFPDSKYIHHWNGGVAYIAQTKKENILWIDEREVLDLIEVHFLDEDFLSKDLITLYIFDSKKERDKYIEDLKFLKKSNITRDTFVERMLKKFSKLIWRKNEK